MKIFLFLLRESWLKVVLALACGLISGVSSARLVALINQAVNDAGQGNALPQFVAFAVLSVVAAPTAQYLLTRLSQDSIYRLRIRLSRQLLLIPLRQVEEQGAHRILPALTGDVGKLSNSVFVIPLICVDFAVVVGCLTYLFYLSRIVFVFTLVTLVMGMLVSQLLLSTSQESMRLARSEQDHLFRHFRTLIQGGKEFRLHHQRREDYLNGQLAPTAARFREHTNRSRFSVAIAVGWANFLFMGIIGLLVFLLPQFIQLEPLVLSGFVLTMTYLMVPIKNLAERIPVLMEIGVSIQKIEEVGLALSANQEPQDSQKILNPGEKFNLIELHDIKYFYSDLSNPGDDSQFCIGPIDLTFSAGEIVFIVGGNGSGKSTLAKLIAGLYQPSEGTISLNGKTVRPCDQSEYRHQFSTVFSDFYLFDLLLGYEDNEIDRRAQRLLHQLKLDHKVKIENGQFSTIDLSQGQRKRLALLSAYLDDRPIYLFDEWAADQDPGFRALFYEEILPGLRDRGKLVLVISHDDAYFKTADRIVKLDYGKVLSVAAV